MGCPCVCVIDNSLTIRETITIVLGDRYRVQSITAEEYLRDPAAARTADVLIVGHDTLPASAVLSLPSVPILWVQAPGTDTLPSGAGPWTLPYPFGPEDVHTRIEAMLAAPPPVKAPETVRPSIEYPALPREAVQLARRAAGTRFPVLICGEPGTGKERLARAINRLGQNGQFVALPASNCTRAALLQAATFTAADLTIFIPEISGISADAEQMLLELTDCGGFSSARGWHHVHLICATRHSFERFARTHGLDPELFYRISVFPITLPPLRERTGDIPTLVRQVTTDLARLLDTQPVGFTQRAMDRLVHYLWFGNLAELEAVLTRSVVLAQRRTLDAEDLLFGYGRLAPRAPEASSAKAVTADAAPDGAEAVDLIINELAHEFKNPMVTIKTVAQHLERLLADETGREQVARLTGEAIDRMDRALENLLQFTRFRAPAPGDVQLNALLSPCLSELAPTLTERRVALNYRPPEPLSVFVDPAQITYAFDNLVRVITRDLPEGQTLSVHAVDGTAAVAFEFTGGRPSVAGRLSEFLEHAPTDGESTLPLGMVFAKALIERNGGRIEVHTQPDVSAITVWLPSREETAPGNGKTTTLSH